MLPPVCISLFLSVAHTSTCNFYLRARFSKHPLGGELASSLPLKQSINAVEGAAFMDSFICLFNRY